MWTQDYLVHCAVREHLGYFQQLGKSVYLLTVFTFFRAGILLGFCCLADLENLMQTDLLSGSLILGCVSSSSSLFRHGLASLKGNRNDFCSTILFSMLGILSLIIIVLQILYPRIFFKMDITANVQVLDISLSCE